MLLPHLCLCVIELDLYVECPSVYPATCASTRRDIWGLLSEHSLLCIDPSSIPFIHPLLYVCFHPSSIHALFCFHPSSIHLLLYVCFHLGPSSGDAYKSSRCEPHEGICLLPVVEDMSTTMLVCHPAPPSNEKMELELLGHTFVLSHEDELFVLSANYPQAGRSLSITAST